MNDEWVCHYCGAGPRDYLTESPYGLVCAKCIDAMTAMGLMRMKASQDEQAWILEQTEPIRRVSA